MSYNFKKIIDLDLVTEVPEGANVLIETDGATKRLPSTSIKPAPIQPDLSQNDPNAADYVKNRTHWEDRDGTVHKLDKKYLPDDIGGGVKYVTIGGEYDENDNVTYTASATYDEIAEWIKSGVDVKCIYENYEFSLVGSSVLSEISTMVMEARSHKFIGFNLSFEPAMLMVIDINEWDNVYVYESALLGENCWRTEDYINNFIDAKLGVIENGSY